SGRWRTFVVGATTVTMLTIAVTLVFGLDIWNEFLASTRFTRTDVLEQGDTGWHKIQSVFSAVRMWGGGIPLAYAVQLAATLCVAGRLVWLWGGRGPLPVQ